MPQYYRIMLGSGSMHATECFNGNFVGTDFGLHQDLTQHLPNQWRTFNQQFVPVYLQNFPEASRVRAGLACGAIWTVSKGLNLGDIVLCPDGNRRYRVGKISGPYHYMAGGILPHRREVLWTDIFIERDAMSEALRNSCGAIGTVSNISQYHEEIERLVGGVRLPTLVSTDETVENPSAFAMEAHLEEFLVRNWAQTELGRDYDIYQENGELVGRQYQTDTGPLDILAISKDKQTLLVVELKKGRASDVVVGQALRYMGYVQDELAEEGQAVKGIIIAHEDDQRIRRALTMVPSVEFYRYQVSFKLMRG